MLAELSYHSIIIKYILKFTKDVLINIKRYFIIIKQYIFKNKSFFKKLTLIDSIAPFNKVSYLYSNQKKNVHLVCTVALCT